MSSHTLIISGAHRSGTSLVADLMRQAGVHVGDRLLGPAAGNPRGHFEDRDFYELHERALARQGRSFLLDAADGLGGFDAAETAVASGLIAARGDRPLWGWKDPRTVLFLDDWDRLVPQACYLFVYRHPLEVVLSLLRRASDLEIAADPMHGVRTWEVHNRAILAFVRSHRDRCVVMGLGTIVADPRRAVELVAERFGLPLRPDAVGPHVVGADLHHGVLPADAAARFAGFAPSATAVLAELDAEATAAGPRDRPAPVPRPPASEPSFAAFLAALDPAAVLASRDALAAFERAHRADVEAQLRERIIATGELEQRVAAEARAAAAARERELEQQTRALAERIRTLEAQLAASPVRRLVRTARRVSAERWRPRPPLPSRAEGRGRAIGRPVLFVSHDAHRHGAQLLLLHLLRWIRAHTPLEFEILLKGGGELVPEFEALAPTHRWPLDPASPLRRADVGLVYSNTITNGEVLADVARGGQPVLTHVHELEHWIRHHVHPAHLREVVQRTSRWVAVSERVRATLIELLGVSPADVDLVYEFLGPDLLRPSDRATTQRIRRALGVPDDAWVVGGSGTMDWRKGSDLFVQLAAAVRRLEPSRPVHFVWLGGAREGDAYAKLAHDARVAGVGDRVHFAGTVTTPAEHTACFDVFALVSREDPFPLVALEAASRQVPIVCFADAGGAPELVAHGCGYVVPYLQVEAMAERVLHLLRAPAERRAMGERGAAHVHAHHTVDVAGPRLVAIIEDLLSADVAGRVVR